jgi:hypothetical protein
MQVFTEYDRLTNDFIYYWLGIVYPKPAYLFNPQNDSNYALVPFTLL